MFIRFSLTIFVLFSLAFAGFADLNFEHKQHGVPYNGGNLLLDVKITNTGHSSGTYGVKIHAVSFELDNTSSVEYKGAIAKFYNTSLCPADSCLHGSASMDVSFVPVEISLAAKPGNYSFRYHIVAAEEKCPDETQIGCTYEKNTVIVSPTMYFVVYPEISEKDKAEVALNYSKSVYDTVILFYPRAKALVAKAGSNCSKTADYMSAGALHLNTSQFRYMKATEGYTVVNYGLALKESITSLTFAVQAKEAYWAAIDAAEACLLEFGVTHADIVIENANLKLNETRALAAVVDLLYSKANSTRCVPVSQFSAKFTAAKSSLDEAGNYLTQSKLYYSSGEYMPANISASASLTKSSDAYLLFSTSIHSLNSSVSNALLLVPGLIKAESEFMELSDLINNSAVLGINDSKTTSLFLSTEDDLKNAQKACGEADYTKLNKTIIQTLKSIESSRNTVHSLINSTLNSLLLSVEIRINNLKTGTYETDIASELPVLEESLKIFTHQINNSNYSGAMKTYTVLEANITTVESKANTVKIQKGVSNTVLFVLLGLVLFLIYLLFTLKKAQEKS